MYIILQLIIIFLIYKCITINFVNLYLLFLKYKFNFKKKEIKFKYGISHLKNTKKKLYYKNKFNLIFKNTNIKLINVEEYTNIGNNTTSCNEVIYNTNKGYISLKLLTEKNDIDDIFRNEFKENNYILELTSLKNYQKKEKIDIIHQNKINFMKETNINYYTPIKLYNI